MAGDVGLRRGRFECDMGCKFKLGFALLKLGFALQPYPCSGKIFLPRMDTDEHG